MLISSHSPPVLTNLSEAPLDLDMRTIPATQKRLRDMLIVFALILFQQMNAHKTEHLMVLKKKLQS
jgi:hypothetical protein